MDARKGRKQSKQKRGQAAIIFLLTLIVIAGLAYITYYLFIFYLPSSSPAPLSPAEKGAEESEITINLPEGTQVEEQRLVILPEEALPERILYLVEKETINLMNAERVKRNLTALQWSEAIANVAFLHGKDMALHDFLNHTNPQGLSVDGRLEQAQIVNFCSSENIFYIESKNPTDELAQRAVTGWLESPGHRKNLLDANITRAGIGIYCEERECFVTANHICTTSHTEETILPRFVYFYQLYPEESSLSITVTIRLQIKTTENADIILVPDKEQYEQYTKRKTYQQTSSMPLTRQSGVL